MTRTRTRTPPPLRGHEPWVMPPETPAARARRLLVAAAEAQVAAFGRSEAVAHFQATARHIGAGWFDKHESGATPACPAASTARLELGNRRAKKE